MLGPENHLSTRPSKSRAALYGTKGVAVSLASSLRLRCGSGSVLAGQSGDGRGGGGGW